MEKAEIRLDGRLVLTTTQAAAQLRVKPGTLRARIARQGIAPADHLDPRTPVYYPEDLGLACGRRDWATSLDLLCSACGHRADEHPVWADRVKRRTEREAAARAGLVRVPNEIPIWIPADLGLEQS